MKAIKFTEENLPLLREIVDNPQLIDARFATKHLLKYDYIVIEEMSVPGSDELYVEWFGLSEENLFAKSIAPFVREAGWFEIVIK